MSKIYILILCATFVLRSAAFADDDVTTTLLSNSFQETVETTACVQPLRVCTLYYSRTTHVTTLVSHVSCKLSVLQEGKIGAMALASQLHAADANYPQPFLLSTENDVANYGVNASTTLFISAGDQPYFAVSVTGSATINFIRCTISGYHS